VAGLAELLEEFPVFFGGGFFGLADEWKFGFSGPVTR
jgi:hypothetical protein